jgi:cyclophilin family peptidyl-prolyl cis-trans isomerase
LTLRASYKQLQENPMKFILTVLVLASSFAVGQTSSSTAAKSTAAKTTAVESATPAPNPTAIIHTTAGDLTCELFPKQAPKTVANFVGLATGTKEWKNPETGKAEHGVSLYNGTIFHRVIPNFMIQGGDPLGTGQGGPGYSFEDEFSPDLTFDVPGRLAMANSGPNTNGSQFFITEAPQPHLDGKYNLFGQCTPESVELVKQIARKATDPRDDRPYDPVKITKIEFQGIAKPASTAAKKPGTTHTGTTHKAMTPKQPAPPQK